MSGHPSRIRTAALAAALAGALATTPANPAAAHTTASTGQPATAAQVQTQAPTIVTVANPRSHRVVAGDTLWAIAARYCGTGRTYPRLARASGITNPDRIYAGRTVVRLDCAGQRPTAMRASRATSRAGGRAQEVVTYARAQVGDAYRWGAAGPNAFDCSGLVVASYRQIGMRLPHYTGYLLNRGRAISRASLRPGDLVFPERGHVGIYVGNGKMVDAPHPGATVQIRTVYGFYAGRRLL